MSFRKLDLVQGSPEWLAARFDYVTASNVPAIMGVSPYKTAYEYASEILTRVEKKHPNDKSVVFARGHQVEKAAREWARSNLNLDLIPSVVVADSPNFLLASLDGLDEERGIVFEAKYVGKKQLQEIKEGRLSAHHDFQVHAQLLATGFNKAIYFAMDTEGDAVAVDIEASLEKSGEIRGRISQFWGELQAGKLPDLAEKDIQRVEDPDFEKLSELHKQMKEVSAQYDALEESVLERYAHFNRVEGGPVSISRFWSKGTVDWPSLARAKRISPEEQERFRKLGSMRTRVTVKS